MELLKSLNEEQKKAVTHGEGPLLIVAGAGTGKTTVVTQRVAWLIAQGKANSDEILAVTFTDKAAGEMSERVDRLLPLGYLDLWISTFHAFCQRVLQDHAIDIGLPSDFVLLDQTSQWLLVRENLDKFELDYYRPLGNPTKFIHALLRHFSRAKDEAITPAEYLAYVEELRLNQDAAESTGGKAKAGKKNTTDEDALSEIARLEEVANAYHFYQQLLLEQNALDFGDVINYTLRLFQKRPKILEQYRKQFKYILVDEFQDTNWAQYELIKLLAAPKNNLTVVADDDQSIYKFRGASVSNVTQFNKDFSDATIVSITTNYRSKQEILDTSHSFIKLNDPNRLEAQSLNGKKVDKHLKAHRTGAGHIHYLRFDDQYDEAAGVVKQIIDLQQKTKQTTWNDFAILIRANSQADIFISALESVGIPYQYVASRGLYSKPIILDVVNFLKLLDDYHESPSLWRVLNWPVFNIKPQTLVGINHFAKKKALSLYQALYWWRTQGKIDEVERAELNRIITLIQKFTKEAQNKRPREVILGFLEDSGYLKWLTNQEEYQTEQQLKYLEQFDKKLKEFETQHTDPTIKKFLEEIQMELESGETGNLENDPDSGPEAVKLMTIHAAKGLEFPYVFIVHMVDKRFPATARREAIELPDALIKETLPEGDIHLEEERRLMYVAITRARDDLFFTGAHDYGGKTKKKPSRFIYELGLESEAEEMGSITLETKALPAQAFSREVKIPNRFSFTQLKSFENCPYQYRFAHILKVPVRANFTLSFGKTMHATLKRFMEYFKLQNDHLQGDLFKNNAVESGDSGTQKIPSIKELLKMYEEEWIDDWYESPAHKDEYRQKGIEILKNFHAKVTKQPPSVSYLEQGFNLKIQNPETKEIYSFFGVIDRVDELENGEVDIIDYKTGTVKNEKTIEKDQLLIYQIAAKEVFNYTPKKLTYYYLNENKPVSFIGTDEELQQQKEKMIDFIARIKNSDFRPTPSEHTCKYCDYRNICEFRKI